MGGFTHRERQDAEVCDVCGRTVAPGGGYLFLTPGGPTFSCTRCAVRRRPIAYKALQTAAVVGTVLTVINHGDALLVHHLTLDLLWKTPLTYVVPYLVSTHGALSISRRAPV